MNAKSKVALAIAKGLALAVLAIVIAETSSCAPRAVVVPPVGSPGRQVQPPKGPDPTRKIEDARKLTGDADAQAATTSAQVRQATAKAEAAKVAARDALALATKLRQQKAATEAELAEQEAAVRKLDEQCTSLSLDLAATEQSLEKEKGLREAIRKTLVEAQEHARSKSAEADTLRMQVNEAETRANEYFQDAKTNANAAVAAQGKVDAAAGAARTWRGIAIWCGVAAALLLLIFVVLPIMRKTSIGI